MFGEASLTFPAAMLALEALTTARNRGVSGVL
jgi:hypothetical protein